MMPLQISILSIVSCLLKTQKSISLFSMIDLRRPRPTVETALNFYLIVDFLQMMTLVCLKS